MPSGYGVAAVGPTLSFELGPNSRVVPTLAQGMSAMLGRSHQGSIVTYCQALVIDDL